MKHRRGLSIVASVGLVAAVATSISTRSASAAPGGRAAIAATQTPLARTGHNLGAVAVGSRIAIDVSLAYRDAAGAAAAALAVSDPTSPSFHHYFTPQAWEQRFSPTAASVAEVTAWLRSEGLTVGAVTPDRLNVSVSGTAAQVEGAFKVAFDTYALHGRITRLAVTNATVPSALGGIVAGVAGLSQVVATPASTGTSPASPPISQPPGFRSPPVCSKYWGKAKDTKDPSYGAGFVAHLPLAICGYTPPQLQTAYGLQREYRAGVTGKGVTVAIVDPYVSPTLLSDSQRYFAKNDPAHPLATSQFAESLAPTFEDRTLCSASGWFGEQTLDIEAVHAVAPGANLLYVGASDCVGGLYSAVESVVDAHAANVITDSWGDNAGDLVDVPSDRTMFDNVLEMAAGLGIGVQFSSGDNGDEFTTTGFVSPDYPASSPWVTAVGGTSLAIGPKGREEFETGWSTSRSVLCTAAVVRAAGCRKAQIGRYVPGAPGAYDYGGGGGTSYDYTEPSYQVGVVPRKLARRNRALTGTSGRVEPDISMDADPTTGMLVGETETFPNGVHYDQYRIGGTSLASPLFAGVMALADQAAGTALGFVNPVLYTSYKAGTSHIRDIVARGKTALARVDFVNSLNRTQGEETSVRGLDYQGPETFCDGSGNCATRRVVLSVTKGYDSMTGLGSPGPGFVAAISKH